MNYDVFISHSSKDKPIADRICKYLEENDINCWIAPRNITGGLPYAREILKGIEESQVVLLVFSTSSNRSRHVESEIDQAFNKGKVIIPFRIEECLMSDVLNYYLSISHQINGSPVSDEALERLKESIISNLPERRTKRDCEDACTLLAREFNISVDELKNTLNKAGTDLDILPEDPKGNYSILQNKKGEIMLMMSARNNEPISPRFIYDGKDMALLYRNKDSAVNFQNISEGAREALMNVSEILVVEEADDDVLREYMVPVRLVKDVRSLIIS